ncbi:type II secretion system protein [bacterium]|nr:type II secretion system protein [bacterium]
MKIGTQKAFTLAEVLVTMGVIGIVAVMTIPVLIQDVGDKQNIVALKKFYSEFYQATMLLMVDYSEPVAWDLRDNVATSSDKVVNMYSQQLNMQKICGPDDPSCFPFPIHSYRTGLPKITESQYRSWKFRGFMLNNGVTGLIDVNNGSMSVFVDVNGFKKPNKLGVDVFAWALNGQGRIVKYTDPSLGRNDDAEYDYAFRIMQDGWTRKY